MDDLFVSLEHNRWAEVVAALEKRIEGLFISRHFDPIWPGHDFPLDEEEAIRYEPIRKLYYDNTKTLIHVLRAMRDLA